MRCLLRILFVTCLIIITTIGGVLLVSYLKANHLLFFSTGTKEKAFLNTTWRMSPKEVERATGWPLFELLERDKYLSQLMHELFSPPVMDKNRYQDLKQSNISLWGHDAEVEYSFFDHKLYEYFISMKSGSALKDSGHKAILTALEARFGVAQPDRKEQRDIIYAYKWESSRERVTYWMTQESDNAYVARIRVTHLPSMSEIEQIVKDEQRNYFGIPSE